MAPPVRRKTKRRKVYRSNSDFAAMLRRFLAAYGRRVAGGDETDLIELVALHQEVDNAIQAAITSLVYDQGFSWATIAQALGVERQTAHERWGRNARRKPRKAS